MQGNKHFSEVMMTNRNKESLDEDSTKGINSIATFPMSPRPNFNRFRSVSPPSTGESSTSSGSVSSVINKNQRYTNQTLMHKIFENTFESIRNLVGRSHIFLFDTVSF